MTFWARLSWVISILIVASTFVPYLVQALTVPEGRVFTWLLYRVPDMSSYLMWMDQHRDGAFMVQNRMALDAPGTILPNPVWLVLGWLSRLTGLSLIATYHLGRAVLALVWLRVLWALCLRLTTAPRVAMAAFLMASLGSGFHWLASVGLPIRSADWITELWTWPSILYYPHFAASLALAGGGFLLYLHQPNKIGTPGNDGRQGIGGSRPGASRCTPGKEAGVEPPQENERCRATALPVVPRSAAHLRSLLQSSSPLLAAVLLGLLVLVHPYTALALFAAITLHAVVARIAHLAGPADTRRALIVLGAMALPFLALALQVATSPAMASWVRENVMPSPPPLQYLMGLGLVGLLAVAGIVRLAVNRRIDSATAFLLVWVACAAILAYGSPIVSVERRCIEGVHVAFALLAAGFIGPWLQRSTPSAAAAVLAALVALVVPTNVATAIHQATTSTPGRVHDDWPAMFDTVRNLPGDRTILANARAGMFLAAFSSATVFAGHDQLTPDLPGKMASIDAFFGQPATWQHRRDFLLRIGARWVIVDPRHPAPGDPFPPDLLHASARTWAIYGPVNAAPVPGEQP